MRGDGDAMMNIKGRCASDEAAHETIRRVSTALGAIVVHEVIEAAPDGVVEYSALLDDGPGVEK